VSAPDLVHADWLPGALGSWLLAAIGVAIAIRIAAGRVDRLLGSDASHAGAGRDLLLLGALLAISFGALGPRWGTETVRVPASGVDVVVLLDVSRSMLARDVAPSRLARARRVADHLLADLTEADRAALAAYSGRGVLLTPLTPDKEALRALLPALDPSLMEPGGSRLGAGVEAALGAFQASDTRPRVLLVLGDGEDPGRAPTLGLEAAREALVRVVSVAFGTAAGAPVPAQTGTLRDADGKPVVSRALPERLAELAAGTKGRFLHADSAGRVERGAVLAAVRREAPSAASGFVERRLPVLRSDWCALLALALVLAESARLLPHHRRRLPAAFVAAAGVVLLGAGVGPRMGAAPELLREGVARAERGELAEAEHAFFAALSQASDPELAADAYFDLGVAALARRDYEAARQAFFDALAVRPGHRETQFNLEWTLIALQSSLGDQPDQPGDDSEDQSERSEREPDETEEPGDEPKPARPPEEITRERPVPRPNPVELDPAAAERWLKAVEDDPQRTLRAAAAASSPRERRPDGPTW
jgi:Ca-activated chloride channel family protein